MTTTGVWVLLSAVVLATGTGTLLRWHAGRVRAASTDEQARVPEQVRALLDEDARVTLVQISTRFCADCRRAGRMLTRLVEATPGIAHRELDVTELPGLAAELRVRSTPTTLAVNAAGDELFRFTGLPRLEELRQRCAEHPEAGPVPVSGQ